VLKVRGDVEFVFAGPWSHAADKEEAESFIERERIADHVMFIGPVSRAQKCSVYESADLFVFPGIQQEGQPLVVIEAMAAGLPIICTDRGCLRETIVEGETGLMVRSGDISGLAERILWCLNNPIELHRMGSFSKERYQKLYTRDQFIKNMARVLSLVAAEDAVCL
jgi:glycosyltransferase involved in cell wall biosynthesis